MYWLLWFDADAVHLNRMAIGACNVLRRSR